MKLRGHGNAVAIALSGLAVVMAASGTAYAVTASTVNIADPTETNRIAHADGRGHPFTVDASNTLAGSTRFLTAGWLVGREVDLEQRVEA